MATSFHCIGMCGPISLVLFNQNHGVTSYLTYHLFRWLGYLFFSSLLFSMGIELRHWISPTILVATFVVLMFVVSLPSISMHLTSHLPRIQNNIAKKLRRATGKYSLPIVLGFFSGILPCGLLYVAYGSTLAFQHYTRVWIAMSLFFVGTFPLLFAGQLFGQHALSWMPKKWRTLWTMVLFVIAIMMLAHHVHP
ncbi:MAG: sulfite exporter TauE/SafE family protein [Bdellovibrionota bacterium]